MPRASAYDPRHPLDHRKPPTIVTALGLLAVALLILATAFFVAAEFSMVAIDRSRLEAKAAKGDSQARLALSMQKRLSFFLSGAQLGITLVSVVLGYVAEPAIAAVLEPVLRPLVGDGAVRGVSLGVALALATVLSMVIGELIPKNIVLARAEPAVRALSRPLQVFSMMFGPLIRLANGTANWVVRRLGVEPQEELASARSIEELARVIEVSSEEGELEAPASTLLQRSIRFTDKTAADVLVPRLALEWLRVDATVGDLIARSLETGKSRFLVCRDDLDDVVGVVHVKDVFRLPPDERAGAPITAIVHEALAVPETIELEDLFREMQAGGAHLALVVDEHGGTAGILTVEDLVEEIVGEIDDEYDFGLTPVERSAPDTWLLAGTLHPDEVEEACGLRLPEGDFETIAGFVLDQLGHVPQVGEVVEHDGWQLEVAEMDRLRIATVQATAPPAARDEDGSGT